MAICNLVPTGDSLLGIPEIYPVSPITHFDKVDDPVGTPDDEATYVLELTGTHTDLLSITNPRLCGAISNLTIHIRSKGGQTKRAFSGLQWLPGILTYFSGNGRTVIKTHGVSYSGTNNVLTASFADYVASYDANPYTEVAWTWAEIADLVIGVTLTAPAYCTAVWAVVTYASTQVLLSSKIVRLFEAESS
jgi:hypothetical protein